MRRVRENWRNLQNASFFLKNDRAIVLAAITQDALALEFASIYLKNDYELVLKAVRKSGRALEFASNDLKNNRTIVLAATRRHGEALEFASNNLKNDRPLVLAAVSVNGEALEFASNDLKNDRDIVLAAVSQLASGAVLEFASADLQNNAEIVTAAVTCNGEALKFASDSLKDNHDIVLAAVSEYGNALEFASTRLQNNEVIINVAVMEKGMALKYASNAFRSHRQIVMKAVKENQYAIQFAIHPAVIAGILMIPEVPIDFRTDTPMDLNTKRRMESLISSRIGLRCRMNRWILNLRIETGTKLVPSVHDLNSLDKEDFDLLNTHAPKIVIEVLEQVRKHQKTELEGRGIQRLDRVVCHSYSKSDIFKLIEKIHRFNLYDENSGTAVSAEPSVRRIFDEILKFHAECFSFEDNPSKLKRSRAGRALLKRLFA